MRERRKVFETDEISEQPAPFPDTAQNLDLYDALMQISEDQRNALYLKQEGYTAEEIAVTMNIPVGTVKSRIFRAKEALRRILEETDNG